MPAGAQTSDEALIIKWHKTKGDFVRIGDILFDIETDKAVLEVESYCEGYLLTILHNEGDIVSAGASVAYIGLAGEEVQDATEIQEISHDNEDKYAPIPDNISDMPLISVTNKSNQRVLSSPLAKKTAREAGIAPEDITAVDGITVKKKDVVEYLSKCRKPDVSGGFDVIPVSPMRKTIARRMYESFSTAPHYTVSINADMTECILLRDKLNYSIDSGIKISFNDILAKCVVKSIEKYPIINASFKNDQIKVYHDVNIGFAVEVDDGLVVPVVKQVNKKTILEIATENAENIKFARNAKLAAERQNGATITISNLGMYGVEWFTAIINPPESCILAVGAIIEKAVSIDGVIVSRKRMSITASFDHRLIDGAIGARFLAELKSLLETPALLFI